MKGRHHIVVESPRLKYEFDIRRNITVIQGDSATGKTTLVELIREYKLRGQDSPVTLVTDVNCEVYTGTEDNWSLLLAGLHNSIVFIDENYKFIYTKEFAEAIEGMDNYYVLITRRPLNCLPYSINEIYGIRTTGKFHFPEKIYHEFYQLHTDEPAALTVKETIFLTEDSKSGFQFVKSCCGDRLVCKSAEGNANIYNILAQLPRQQSVIVLADGAAFGAYIAKVVALCKIKRNVLLYMPESFEWLILKSGIFTSKELVKLLETPEAFIDSSRYFSWERFFTSYLETMTANDNIRRYRKALLASFYLDGKNQQLIVNTFPEAIQTLLRG